MALVAGSRAEVTVGVNGVNESRRELETLGGAMGNIGGKISALQTTLGALGAAAAVTAFAGWIKGAIDATDAASDLSQKTGIAVQDLAGLELAYKMGGMEADALASTQTKLSKAMVDGNEGLEKLGINAKNLDGSLKSNKEVLYSVADSFAAMEDGAEKTALAMTIFGKSGADMIPMLNGGSAGLREMDEMAAKLGLTLSEEAVEKAGAFNDTLDLIMLGGQGVARGIAAELLPTLSSLAGSFLTSMTQGERLKNTAQFLANVLRILYTVGVGIVEVFSTVGKTLGAAGAQLIAIMKGDFKAAAQIGRDWADEIGNDWSASAKAISDAWNSSGNETVDAMVKITAKSKVLGQSAAEVKKQSAEAAKDQAEQAKMFAELAGLTGSFAAEWDRLSKSYAKGALTVDQLTEAQAKLLAKQPGIKKGIDDDAKAEADLAKATEAARDAVESDIESILAQAEALESKVDIYGLLPDAITAVQIAELEASKQSLVLTEEGVADIQRKIDALNRLRNAQSASQRQEASAEEVKKSAAEQVKMWESVENTAHDTFISIFDSGKSAFDRLTDTLKNGLYDLLYQMTIKKWMINIGASVGMTGVAGAAQAGTALGGVSGVGSALSAASGLSGLAGIGGTAIAGVGNFLGASSMSAFGAGFAGSTGGMAMTASEMFASMGMAAEASAASIGALASAALPWVAGLGIAVALWKKFDTSGTYHTGGASSASASGSTTIRAESIGFEKTRVSAEVNDMTAQLARGVVGILDSTAATFGKTAGYTAATAFADDTSKDGAWGSLIIKNMDGTVVDWNQTRNSGWAPREFADGQAGQEQYLAEMGKSVRTALDSIGLPSWAREMLNSLGSNAGLDELAQVAQEINKTQSALKGMGQQMSIFANLSDGVASKLIAAAGGIESLASAAAAYYNNFYTDAEKSAAAMRQVGTVLASVNLAIPATKEEFRALVEANMALGEGGAKTVAALLSVNEVFSQVIETTGSAGADLSSYRSALTEAYNAESQALQSTITRMGAFATGLRDLNKSALLGNLSPLSPAEKYAEAKAQYEAVAAAARDGDENAQGRYQDVYTAFLEASRAVYASGAGYQQDFNYAQAMTAEVARLTEGQISVDQAQLDMLKSQVAGIVELNKSVLSMRDALQQYNQALSQQASTPATAPIPYYPSEGRTNDAAAEALLYQVAGLREDQKQQVGDQIKAQAEVMSDAATKIARAVLQPWKFANDETRVFPE